MVSEREKSNSLFRVDIHYYNKILSIAFEFTIDTYIWLSDNLLQKFSVLLLFEPSKSVWTLQNSILDLKENITMLVNVITIFLALMKENQKEEQYRACKPAVFRDASGIIKEKFGVC